MKLCNSSIILCLLRLALQFANCQLVQSGQKSFPCNAKESVASCLEKVDTNAWTSYTNFYTHTHNMCYFLKSQLWQVCFMFPFTQLKFQPMLLQICKRDFLGVNDFY